MFRLAKRTRRDDARLLADARRQAKRDKLTPASLAEGAGIDKAEAAQLLDTKGKPRIATITTVAEFLGLNTSEYVNESDKYHVFFKDHMGLERRVPATSDKHTSQEYGRHLVRLTNARKTRSELPAELLEWVDSLPPEEAKRLVEIGLIDGATLTATQDIDEHVKAWVDAIRRRGKTAKHTDECERVLKVLLQTARVRSWGEVTLARIEAAVEKVPTKSGNPPTPPTRNKHIAVAKAFARFMVKTRRARHNPLAELDKIKTTQQHRRSLSRDEANRLLVAARNGPMLKRVDQLNRVVWEGSGYDRYMIYLFELHTGVRAGSLGKLRVGDFMLDGQYPSVHVQAANEKNRCENRIPLRPELVAELRGYLAMKTPTAPAFNIPLPGTTAWMVRQDLAAAKAAYIEEGKSKREQEQRRTDSFLAERVPGSLPFDFHSLRVTAATLLQEGGVPVAFVGRILNQRTLAVTVGSYTQPAQDTLYGVIRSAAPLVAIG